MVLEEKHLCIEKLTPFLGFLNFIGGYPFYAKKGSNGVEFGRGFIFKHVLSFSAFCCNSICFILLLSNGADFTRATSYTAIDYLSGVLGVCNSVFFSFVVMILFIRRRTEILALFRNMDDVVDVHDRRKLICIHAKYISKNHFTKALLIVLLINVLGPLTNYSLYTSVAPEVESPVLKWTFVATSVGLVLFGFLNPKFAGSYLQSLFFISLIEGCFWQLNDDINTFVEKKETRSRRNNSTQGRCGDLEAADKLKVAEMIDFGHLLINRLEEVKKVLSPFLLIHFTTCLVSATAYTYGASAIFFVNISILRCLLTAAFSLLGVIYFYALYTVCYVGQRLENVLKLVRRKLKSNIYPRHDGVKDDRDLRHSFDMLVERLDEERVIRPSEFFDVNHAGFLGTVGTISSYLVVLLQFKATESA